MALDVQEGGQTAVELVSLGLSIAATARALPPEKTGVQVAAAILRKHGVEIADLSERIEQRVKS